MVLKDYSDENATICGVDLPKRKLFSPIISYHKLSIHSRIGNGRSTHGSRPLLYS